MNACAGLFVDEAQRLVRCQHPADRLWSRVGGISRGIRVAGQRVIGLRQPDPGAGVEVLLDGFFNDGDLVPGRRMVEQFFPQA